MRNRSRDERVSGRIAAVVGACFGIVLLVIAGAALEGGGTHRVPQVSDTPTDRVSARAEPLGMAINSLPPRTRIYECQTPAGRVLSDTVCGPNAVSRELDTSRLNTYQPVPAPEVPVQSEEPSPTIVASPRADDAPEVPRRECLEIQAQIDAIDARTRQAYSAVEGEHWRARRRALRDLYYDRRCSITDRR